MPCFNGGRRGGFDELGLPGGPMTRARRLRLRVFRVIVLVLGAAFFLVSFAYLILVLPFAYRALDAGLSAIDVKTLSEAARSLGAGWGTVIFRVIAPNMASALLNACLLSVALVLGEFTFANLLSYLNLQVEIFQLGLANAGTSIAVSVASLMFAFILLVILSFFGRPRRRVAPERTGLAYPSAAAGPK